MQALANRLQKVNKHLSKWARREGITCFRIYDWDMPEFPLCIDRYEDYLHVAEYKTYHNLSDGEHDAWLQECMATIGTILQVPANHIFLKERKRQSRREEQYEKKEAGAHTYIVNEGGLRFWVNLSDYLDTGLFLDHRPLRNQFRAEAKGKHVLNLFCYTGSFSVYAQAGGAASVTSVDLSGTYLKWCQDNMELNGLESGTLSFEKSDVMEYLKQYKGPSFDLVFVDPPAFSNSKKMKGTWDTQRDHPALLQRVLDVTTKGGCVYFSNNVRRFKPQFEKLNAESIADIGTKTVPPDFRNKKIHNCYKILK